MIHLKNNVKRVIHPNLIKYSPIIKDLIGDSDEDVPLAFGSSEFDACMSIVTVVEQPAKLVYPFYAMEQDLGSTDVIRALYAISNENLPDVYKVAHYLDLTVVTTLIRMRILLMRGKEPTADTLVGKRAKLTLAELEAEYSTCKDAARKKELRLSIYHNIL